MHIPFVTSIFRLGAAWQTFILAVMTFLQIGLAFAPPPPLHKPPPNSSPPFNNASSRSGAALYSPSITPEKSFGSHTAPLEGPGVQTQSFHPPADF
jgi:hypothetical protein